MEGFILFVVIWSLALRSLLVCALLYVNVCRFSIYFDVEISAFLNVYCTEKPDSLPTSKTKRTKTHQESYPIWAFIKYKKRSSRNISIVDKENNKWSNGVIPYVAGISEKLRRIFNQHNICAHFKANNILRQ
uniref:Uncharacterized protein n=1 Tax=Micrurus lemniscatus lemniscatus TaxID=129467 RepID=A0A2D4IN41_MICLE